MIYDYIFVTTNYGQKSMKKNKRQEHKIYVETQSEKKPRAGGRGYSVENTNCEEITPQNPQ